tara:strand:- start:380 stop:535 length:156 start_codon:yes stop_codon:yes gene_type:complete
MKNLIIETDSDINELTEALNDAGIRCIVYEMEEYVSVFEKLAKLKELAGEE